jgi:hypothetical protein
LNATVRPSSIILATLLRSRMRSNSDYLDRRRIVCGDELAVALPPGYIAWRLPRNAAAKRFGVSIASAVPWVARFKAKGEISPAPTGRIVLPVTRGARELNAED